MKRYGMVIRVRPELEDAYVHLHANTWPAILQRISDSNIRNYTIFFAGRLSVRLLRICRRGLRGGHGDDGG